MQKSKLKQFFTDSDSTKLKLQCRIDGVPYECHFDIKKLSWEIKSKRLYNHFGPSAFFAGGIFVAYWWEEPETYEGMKFFIDDKIFSCDDRELSVKLDLTGTSLVKFDGPFLYELIVERKKYKCSSTFIPQSLADRCIDPTFDFIDYENTETAFLFFRSFYYYRKRKNLPFDFDGLSNWMKKMLK